MQNYRLKLLYGLHSLLYQFQLSPLQIQHAIFLRLEHHLFRLLLPQLCNLFILRLLLLKTCLKALNVLTLLNEAQFTWIFRY